MQNEQAVPVPQLQSTPPAGQPPRRKFDIDIDVDTAAKRRNIIFNLTWPALAEQIMTSLVSIVGTIMVSSLGTYAISGVSLAVQPRFIMLSVFMALNVGCTAIAARLKGAGDRAGASNVLRQSLILAVSLCIVVCGLMLVFNEPLIRFIAGDDISEKTIQAGISYFRIQLFGFPFTALTFAMNAVLRGVGNTRASFYNNGAANIVNVIMNYCLINGHFGFPALGVIGSSYATLISQAVAFTMVLSLLLRGNQYVLLTFKARWYPDFSMISRILKIGFPAMIEQLFMRVGMLLYTTTVTSLGDIAYSAHVIANNIQQLSFTTGMAFGTAATTLMGQSLGKKKPALARTYIRDISVMAIGVSILIGLGLFFFGRNVSTLYTDEGAVLSLSAQALIIVAVAQPFQSVRFVLTSALRGAGDSRFTAVITLIGILIVRPFVSWLLVNWMQSQWGMGLIGAWIALISDQMTCFVLSLIRYKKGRWAVIKV